MDRSVQVVSGRKKTRGEIRLPQLHFIMMDDWEQKIGQQALWTWLKLYTMADRTHKKSENDIVPDSMNKLIKKIGVGRETFYNKIIRPLWNYGFIDLQEISIPTKEGYNPVNIIVYEYPNNDPATMTKPLQQIRDYDKDYQTNTRIIAKKGGRPAKTTPSSDRELPHPSSDRELPLVLTENYPSSDREHNNVLNQSNVLNDFNVKKIDIDSEAVKNAIAKDKKLLDRLTDLHQVYLLVKENPFYNDALFIKTARKSVKAIITHTTFGDYFLTAMLNNMESEKQKNESSNPVQENKEKSDLPDWVANQSQREEQPKELSEEQKRQARELLQALGEIK